MMATQPTLPTWYVSIKKLTAYTPANTLRSVAVRNSLYCTMIDIPWALHILVLGSSSILLGVDVFLAIYLLLPVRSTPSYCTLILVTVCGRQDRGSGLFGRISVVGSSNGQNSHRRNRTMSYVDNFLKANFTSTRSTSLLSFSSIHEC